MKIGLLLVITASLVSAKTDLSGSWGTECEKFSKHSYKTTILFKDNVEKIAFKLYEDSLCQSPSLTVDYEGTYAIGAKFGEGSKFNSIPSKVHLTVHLQSVLEQFNKSDSEDGCGIKKWKLNTSQDVSGKSCRPFRMPTIGKTIYDIYKLNLNSLVFSNRPIKWDVDDPFMRPKTLSKVEFFSRK